MNKNFKPSFTLDDSTYASNPGRVEVNYLYWIRSFPNPIIKLLIILIFLFVVTFLINWAFGIALFDLLRKGKNIFSELFALLAIIIFDIFLWYYISPLLNKIIFQIVRIREHFIHGCVNPGIVVSLKPFLIAVFTDLTTNGESHYAIKILPQPLQWMKSGIPRVGTKVATVALYEGVIEKGYWDDFYPIVVDCVTGNQIDIKRVFRSIPDWEWQVLEAAIKQISTPEKPGLYFIHFDS